ncbi:MAG: thiamine pyrophosphate-dependent dehydrogenase E1 component subunit alpha [Bacteroidia bacterium]|nr:thiamine pyrophosphate-dependent dehydrogenase E1 component subunit alpha [Bacteroidia bacterium]
MMKRIRLCEESLIEPISNGEIRCPVHLYSGEEAVATGVCAALEKNDYVFGNHRSHGHYLAKGGSMDAMIAEIYGKKTGCSKGRGGSMHLIDPEKGVMGVAPIVAGTISLAAGAALASQIRKDKRVTVTFFGDGATGEGGLYEMLSFAGLKKLPVIFVCENNLYSTHLPVSEIRVDSKISEIAKPFQIETYTADGNNVIEVYELAKKAVEKCRNNEGPVFLEFLTFRLRGHVGPNDTIQGTKTDIRPKAQIDSWKKNDPILRFKKHLLDNDILSADEIFQIDSLCEKEVENANIFSAKSSMPNKNELSKYVFKE